MADLDREFHELLYAPLGNALAPQLFGGAQKAMAVRFRGTEARAVQESRGVG